MRNAKSTDRFKTLLQDRQALPDCGELVQIKKKPRRMTDEKNENVNHHDDREAVFSAASFFFLFAWLGMLYGGQFGPITRNGFYADPDR